MDDNAKLPFLIVVVVCLFALSASTVQAGAWGRMPGTGFFKLSYATYRAGEGFDQNGDTVALDAGGVPSGDFVDISVNAYAEYGLTRNATLVATLPIKRVSKADDIQIGIGDLWVGVRTPVLTKGAVVSFQSNFKLPLYKQSQFASPSLGTAKVEGDICLLVGRSFWPLPIYATSEIGHRWRNAFGRQVFYSAEVGGTSSGGFGLLIRMSGVDTRVDPAGVTLDPANPNLGDQDYLTLGGGLSLKIGEIGWVLDVSKTVSGQNTAKGLYLAAGVFREW